MIQLLCVVVATVVLALATTGVVRTRNRRRRDEGVRHLQDYVRRLERMS